MSPKVMFVFLFCIFFACSVEESAIPELPKNKESLEKALSIEKDVVRKSNILDRLALLSEKSDNYSKALGYYETLIEHTNSNNLILEEGKAHFNKALLYKKLAKLPNAIKGYLNAVHIFEKLEENRRIAITYEAIGSMFASVDQYKSASHFFEKTIKYYWHPEKSAMQFSLH